jgi:hypothetical protein
MVTSEGQEDRGEVEWRIKVQLRGELISRQVWRGGELMSQGCHGWEPEEVIWPTWPGRSNEEVATSGLPLAGVEKYWSTTGNRLRDSAKWMATVLGAALAAIAGTSPLTAMRQHTLQPNAIIVGILGLCFLFVTLLLVIQVMRPQSVSFTDVQYSKQRGPLWRKLLYKKPLYKWQKAIEEDPDLYLPCEVRCLTALRQSMIIEEGTLIALSRAKAAAQDQTSRHLLCDAQSARAARLLELRVAAAKIATVGEYYNLRHRSSWATYGGIVCGLAGTIGIVAAFAWPPR